MSDSAPTGDEPSSRSPLRNNWGQRLRRLFFGAPRDPLDRTVFHRISVVAFLAWVGLGADGISSSCYGPEEAFRTLGDHAYLAVVLAGLMIATVAIISIAYSRVIEHFPQGGGGYVVATALLGEKAGVVSGSALLVDYVLTIAISIAAAGDALFSFLPPDWQTYKLSAEFIMILFLVALNIRGVKESILVLLPVFLLFILTHAVLIGGGILAHAAAIPDTIDGVSSGFQSGISSLGIGALLLLIIHAYSLGGGTYTGIEAVSNGLPIMRDPKVRTGKRTMLYMALSLGLTAAGLIICYLLWGIGPVPGKTMNAVLVERFVQVVPLGYFFVIVTMISEGALLVVAAQAGFVDGPRVLANMAVDGWVPKMYSSLSEQLTTRNGIVLMGVAALAALLYTGGDVRHLVVMYSINVFVTFSLTEMGMCRLWVRSRATEPRWVRKISIHVIGLVMCLTILTVIVIEKFTQGGWLTLIITSLVIALCFLIRRHYRTMQVKLGGLYESLVKIPQSSEFKRRIADRKLPTAVILVSGYTGVGIHSLFKVRKEFPSHCQNLLFLSVAVVDSDAFRINNALDQITEKAKHDLQQYVNLANVIGVAADCRLAIGTDAVAELERLCLEAAAEYPKLTFFAGQLVFQKDRWYQRILHNETAFALQKRLQLAGKTMIILPARV